jgi:hypothetical protein
MSATINEKVMNIRRLLRWLGVLAVMVLAALWLHSTYVFVRYFNPAARTLPTELNAARKEGLILTVDELRGPAIPDSQNAAPLYVLADSALKARSKQDKGYEGRVVQLARSRDPAEREQARAIIMRRAGEIALVERASELPRCRFDRPWERGPDVLLPEYASMRELARLLAARAILQAESGDLEAAFRSVSAGAKVGRHASDDRILIGLLVNIAIYAIMDNAFQRVTLSSPENRRVTDLAANASAFPHLPTLEHGFSGEIVMCRSAVNIVRNENSVLRKGLDLISGKSARRRAIMCDAWEARMISYWREVFRRLRAANGDLVAQARALESLGDELQKRDGQPTYELAAILMPVFSQAALKLAAGHEQQRLRRTLVELVRYRQRHVSWPVSLEDLPDSVETDIFTGKPPTYRRTAAGFELYSVGDDLKDDGGLARKDKVTGAFDLVIRYPQPGPAAP